MVGLRFLPLCLFLVGCRPLTDCDEGVCLSMQAPPGIPLSVSRCHADGLAIMPLGDSLTDGLTIPGGYRVELWRRIAAAGLHDHFVGSLENGPADLIERHHEGHSGFRIDQIQERVAGWMSSAQPDLVLLMIGTNDVLQAFDLRRAPERLARLVDTILAASPRVRVLLATLPPDQAAERQTREFNRGVRVVAKARAARVTLVDMHAALSGTPGLFPPANCHPTVAGHQQIGDLWWSAIRSVTARNDGRCDSAANRSSFRAAADVEVPIAEDRLRGARSCEGGAAQRVQRDAASTSAFGIGEPARRGP